MVDNVEADGGSGGATFATDDIGSVHYPISKLGYGALDSVTLVTTSAGFPVQLQTGHADIKISLDGEAVVLGAGSAAFGKLAANSGVDIGDVDVTSIIPGTNVNNLGKLFDGACAFAGTEVGVMDLAVRQDTLGSLGNADNDYQPLLSDSSGCLYVALTMGGAKISTSNGVPVQQEAGATFQVQSNSANLATETTLSTLSGNVTACNTGAVVISSGTVTTVSTVTAVTDITNVVSVDDNSSSLTVDTTGTGGLEVIQDTAADLNVTEASAGAIKTAVELIDNVVAVLGTATYSEATTSGAVVGAVRNDDLATLANTDNEVAPLQVNSAGALFTEPAAQVDYVFDGSIKCEIKRKSGLAASGTTAMVSAVASKKIRILALFLKATSATVTNVYVATTTDTDVLGDSSNPIPLAVDADGDNDSGFVLPWNPGGWTETSTVNEALNLVLSAAQDIIYAITYIEVA
jgi:hypothetical protein